MMAAATMALVFTGASGYTAAADSRCQIGRVCAYQNGQWMVDFPRAVRPGECIKAVQQVNQMHNLTGYYQRMWTSTNCSGTSFLVRPGEEITGPGYYWTIGGY